MPQFKARPTVYRGVQMRSRLEAGFAAWLDQCGFDWEYEPRAFASEQGQYLPDFRIEELEWIPSSTAPAYVEVKPSSWGQTDVELMKLRASMLVIHESEPATMLLVVRQGWDFPVMFLDFEECPLLRQAWSYGRGQRPGISTPYHPGSLPWAGEYWKVA